MIIVACIDKISHNDGTFHLCLLYESFMYSSTEYYYRDDHYLGAVDCILWMNQSSKKMGNIQNVTFVTKVAHFLDFSQCPQCQIDANSHHLTVWYAITGNDG